jgi:DNA-binding helix-hairpin-helix protein with protein kinase domain
VDLDGPFLLKAELEGLVAARAELPVRLAEAERDVQAGRAARQRAAYLARLNIAHADIPGAAPDLTARLAAAGVTTAADLYRQAPVRLPGLTQEEATRLSAWLAEASARFRPDPSLSPEDRDALARRHRAEVARAVEIDRRIDEGLARLEDAAAAVEAARTARHEDVDALLRERMVLVREIEHLGKTAPAPPAAPPRLLKAETRARAAQLKSARAV